MGRINFEAILKQVGVMCLVDKLLYVSTILFFKAKLKHNADKDYINIKKGRTDKVNVTLQTFEIW